MKYPQSFILWLFITALGLLLGGWYVHGYLMRQAEAAITEVRSAVAVLPERNFNLARAHLVTAERDFSRGARWLGIFSWLPSVFDRIPGFSHLITGEAVFRAGRDGTRSAISLLSIAPNLLAETAPSDWASLWEVMGRSEQAVAKAASELESAERAFRRVRTDLLPVKYQAVAVRAQEVLPLATAFFRGAVKHQALLEELLGQNGPRIYLFLFQNNHELRATGGFIGSYALLDVQQGKSRRFFVDGIFNPDGQLKENIIPPAPIQKISAGWSLHDSNWFPDFPVSAEKAIFFYEKSGGPTVDGIITLTPEVLERILALVGPIPLAEYGVTMDATNFMPIIQEEVEVKFDREENNPKRILGDLTEALITRFLSFEHPEETWRLGAILTALLNEKHILLYSRHPETQQLIRGAGWSGEIHDSPHDFLSVIHTNINGYKTDGVIRETIEHEAVIEIDGRVIDTVTIIREHQGGQTPYPWWNKVNADYLRVYVPKGSKLLSASGMTREFPKPPLDYVALGFREDADIVREERGTTIDEESGTRISEDAGKTVFGNWVYVSPGETVMVRYQYELPFRVNPLAEESHPVSAYSTLYQKQSGSEGVQLTAKLSYPDTLEPVWQTPENLIPYQRSYETKQVLTTDFFWGTVFRPMGTGD